MSMFMRSLHTTASLMTSTMTGLCLSCAPSLLSALDVVVDLTARARPRPKCAPSKAAEDIQDRIEEIREEQKVSGGCC